MKKEDKFYTFLAMVVVCILAFIYADKVWNAMEKALKPLARYNQEDDNAISGSGNVDADRINIIHINWEKGDVAIVYSDQDRITWRETFVKGDPNRFNTQYYWMNNSLLSIEFRTQEYFDLNKDTNRDICKNLIMRIPKGLVMEEIVVHTWQGTITCEVEAKRKDLKTMSDVIKKVN